MPSKSKKQTGFMSAGSTSNGGKSARKGQKTAAPFGCAKKSSKKK